MKPDMPDASYLFDAASLPLPWASERWPVGIVDLDRAPAEVVPLELPPFPVIGTGDPAHPLAAQLDVVVEPPFALGPLVESICAQAEAAAVAVQLLRLIEGMKHGPALVAESLAYAVLQGSDGHGDWLASRVPAEALPPGAVAVSRAGDTLAIRLERPWAHNAIDRPMRDRLREAFELAALDASIARVVLTGTGRNFSLGADLAEFGTTRDPATAHAIRMLTLPAPAIARCADKLDAHVQGACVGSGLEMAAWAARLTASPRAWFHLPELAMGVLPGAGGCVALTRRIGRQRTALLLLSGRRITGRTALAWGLVDALVDDAPSDDGEADVAGEQP